MLVKKVLIQSNSNTRFLVNFVNSRNQNTILKNEKVEQNKNEKFWKTKVVSTYL